MIRSPMLLVVLVVACSDPPAGGSLALRGEAVEVMTGAVVDGEATMTVEGLSPTKLATGLAITGVPNGSIVDVVVTVPGHHATRSTVTFGDTNVDADLPVVSDAQLAQYARDGGVTMTPERGVALLHVAAAPEDIMLFGDAVGPIPIAVDWIAYFEVAPGLVLVTPSTTATIAVDAQLAITANTVTVAEVTVLPMLDKLPAPLRFQEHVVPIFDERGCTSCHADLAAKIADHVMLTAPTSSPILAKPSRGDPDHPNVMFSGPGDLAYRTILQWIVLGAKVN